jgi:signal transduction histidine kinase
LVNVVKGVSLLFSLLSGGASFYLFQHHYSNNGYPYYFLLTFYTFIGLSLIISIFLSLVKTPWIHNILLSLRVIIIVLIGYMFQDDLSIETILYAAFLLEIGANIEIPRNIYFSVITLIIALMSQFPSFVIANIIFSKEYIAPSMPSFFFFLYILFLVALTVIVFKFYFTKCVNYKNDIKILKDAVRNLTSANIDFQHYASFADEQATLCERKRITRDIHDVTGYIFTNLTALMELAISIGSDDPQRLNEIHMMAKNQAKEGLSKIRQALHEQRESYRDSPGGIKAILKTIKIFQSILNIEIKIEWGNISWSYGNDIDDILHHIIQEALTNALHHGDATNIWISFWQDVKELKVNIQDNGMGASVVKKGIGLSGMEERLETVGGWICVDRKNQIGFSLSARIPLVQSK